ncbi:PHP domain-containing protein [Pigmentiphaga aceris]|uniref:PHP domain-containing protein n=1 Tax=Pigmentiphaga aceris TaxID=1940612 RepID=A0A5C0AWK5_9BURK|nr:3',5'-nucleoside bisphosphate phosphatase [Pigmentiphaga aceris]QEI05763.1 PHP domain-containing protein [Pigmentiphaga aceris]
MSAVIDLHCHSTFSDGVLTPQDLLARAHTNGVNVLALTDHDGIGGLPDASAAAREYGIRLINGVEISVTWAGHTIHIVGLNVDPASKVLQDGLAATRAGRDRRGQEIAEQLAKVGIPGAWEGALRYVGNPDLISRSHFARYLVEIGACPSVSKVFENYLTDGKPGYVPMRWASLDDAIAWIRAAGGMAVVAHPGRYALTDTQFWAFFTQFRDQGGEGVEVVTGSHTPDQYAEYADVARRFGLRASRGSDFHSPTESHMDLGGGPPLPSNLIPVWRDWF